MDRLSAWLDSFPLKAAALAPWPPDGMPPAARKPSRCAYIHCVRSGVATFGDGADSEPVRGPAFVFVPGTSRHRCADADLGRVLSATVRFGTSADASVLGTMPALVVLAAGADTPLAAACQRIFDETHAGVHGLRASSTASLSSRCLRRSAGASTNAWRARACSRGSATPASPRPGE